MNADEVAALLTSKDPDEIMDGLAELLKVNTVRLAKLIEEEKASGEHVKAADRLANSLFQQSVLLAKLRDPKLHGQGDQKHLHLHVRGHPKELTSQAVAALEREGVEREAITEDMIIKKLKDAELIDGS